MRWGEATWLEVNKRRLALSSSVSPQKTLKIVHLSDLHASPVVELSYLREAIDLAVDQKPDLFCLTGDYITAKYNRFEEYAAALKKLSQVAPSFACMGNHDGGSWVRRHGYPDTSNVARMLENAEVALLHNASARVTIQNHLIQLVGLGDLWAGELNAARAFAQANGDLPTIVLSHNPDSKALLSDQPWQLMLCGHTHGGQLRLPIFGTPFAPVRDKKYVAGLNAWGNRWVHTTRGIGNLHGLRFNCRPEISVLEITLGA